MTDEEKWNRAVFIAIDNLQQPNERTRQRALDEDVLIEFYEVRQQLIEEAHRKFISDGQLNNSNVGKI
jgi:hypothetical protein